MKRISLGIMAAALSLSTAAVAWGQTEPTTTTVTKTTAVQNSDGTFTIIEYPVGKEVTVAMNPVSLNGAKGVATVLRDPNGTTIKLNFEGMPNELTSLNLYAIDPTGKVIGLGPMVLGKGVGVFTTTTQLNQFMIIASPDPNLATYTAETKVLFRSEVPEGYAVVPLTTQPVGEKVAATTTTGTTPAFAETVPMLNIPAFKTGDDTKMNVHFNGELAGARANVFIEPHKAGNTEVRFRFHDLKEAPKGKVYTVWAVSADNQCQRLGQVVNVKGRNEAEIKAETTFPDFGLLVTMESLGDIKSPGSARIAIVELP